MAAGTTILGMLPLLRDAFFVSMAVTIMFGLGFAAVLTLIVVPVLYAIFFRVPSSPGGSGWASSAWPPRPVTARVVPTFPGCGET